VANGDVVIEHMSTNLMHAYVLTKLVQDAQFERKIMGFTSWALGINSVRVFPENFSLDNFIFIS
jgi:hypothetical protein